MKISEVVPTDYAANVVACKLWGLGESPIEYIFAQVIFKKLRYRYPTWKCWVYSDSEYRQALADGKVDSSSFILVPQWPIEGVGLVDLAVFIPLLDRHRPLVVVETDGHQFHERTPEQASKDRRRARRLQRLNIAVLQFTGTDIVRGSEEFAQETVDFIVADMRRRWRLAKKF